MSAQQQPYYLMAAPEEEAAEAQPAPGEGPGPGYLKQTFTSSSPHYTHYSNERIRNAFSPASCWSVKAIPAKISAQSVQDARLAQLMSVRAARPAGREAAAHRPPPRFFTPLRYDHADYDADRVKAKRDADIRELNLISFSRKPFRLSSSKTKLQHEDIIDNENFVYPTLGPSDEALMYRGRGAEIDKSKPAYGLFRPGGRATKEQQQKEEGRRSVPDWSRAMFRQLSADWPQLRFRLRFTTEDEFVFSFDAPAAPTEGEGAAQSAVAVLNALNRYMKHFAAHGLASEYRLIKRGDRWNCLEPSAAPLPPAAAESASPSESDPPPASPERRLRFEDSSPAPSPARGTQPLEPRAAAGAAVVYSFYAPWVTVAGVKTRRAEALRSRAMARTGSLNLAQTLAPLAPTAPDALASSSSSAGAAGGRRRGPHDWDQMDGCTGNR